jgi:hypothetical protein
MLLCIVLLIYYTCDVNICVEIDPGTHMLCTRLCPLETGVTLGYCQPHSVEWLTVGAAQAALSPCQTGQWSREVIAVTSALSTGGRALG